MFDALLAAKEDALVKWKKESEYENFTKSVQKLKRDMETMGIKPSKEKLYGRPYRV
ncbi:MULTISPECIES: hypothetical protein [Thermoactinomyces]|uniref:Uncharacterized protein n=1 Tax=Thermoactinomyces daqus TaxID=1329516 RepID=A0A7W1XA54_9BACL|nr:MULTISPECIES: hypothetical protein [Thermoactinomyces]MBA4542798.1 hypothetical protein [Thermoactinomyces daqus]MBH8598529.1 hypothetical protein [Thermoactinomyces sp. CICC 10523]MBH8604627.1 hypothetical protein [Thermoactinomyces sp. CICC 10522]MBH8606913.1 hypothetical protein [Thermoactinomyces sp. CICC 10521]